MEEDLDEVPMPVQLRVVAPYSSTRGIGWDDVVHTVAADGSTDVASIVAGIRDASLALRVLDERRSHGRFVLLSRSQRDVERSPLEIYDRVELGRKTSTRASQSIVSEPPFPPAAS